MADNITIFLSYGRKMTSETKTIESAYGGSHCVVGRRYTFEDMSLDEIGEMCAAWSAAKKGDADAWTNWLEKNK